MQPRRHRDLEEFASVAEPLFRTDAVTHTVALTVLAQLRNGWYPMDDVRALITVHDRERPVGAALRVEGWPLLASGLPPETAEPVARALFEHDPDLTAVSGPRDRATAFAAAWCAALPELAPASTGHLATAPSSAARPTPSSAGVLTTATAGPVEEVRLRLFRLGRLVPPDGVPGSARLAGPADLDLVAEWMRAFHAEAAPESPSPEPETLRGPLERPGELRALLLWLDGGEPVALAGASAPIAAMSRIGPVYTPPDRRGRGYGSAITAAATRWALRAGARHVVLFTDLANPISNDIYPRLGYRPVHDAVQLALPARSN